MHIKICGLSTPETMAAALDAGAEMIGLVFHPKSPRFVSLDRAASLAGQARGRAAIVALVVDAEDGLLAAILSGVRPDLWQFHGAESFERIRDVRANLGLPVMKAIGIGAAEDVPRAAAFGRVADRLLLDARPPKDAAYPGGHGRPFDWGLLASLDASLPFMLSGGLTPENVGAAIRALKARGLALDGVDVSSGVESAPGVKDEALIAAFIEATRAAGEQG